MHETEENGRGYLLKGRVLDGSLTEPIQNAAVVVRADKIVWVGAAAQLPSDVDTGNFTLTDLPNRTIMPGLIDGHTHISFGEARSEGNYRSVLRPSTVLFVQCRTLEKFSEQAPSTQRRPSTLQLRYVTRLRRACLKAPASPKGGRGQYAM